MAATPCRPSIDAANLHLVHGKKHPAALHPMYWQRCSSAHHILRLDYRAGRLRASSRDPANTAV